MRAKFTVTIPQGKDGTRPNEEQFLKQVRANGWSLIEIEAIEDLGARREQYKQRAEPLWKEMPEVTTEERKHVIFYGLLENTRTELVITRRTEAQANFRLHQANLARLQRATSNVVSELVTTHRGEAQLAVAENEVVVYERGHEEILIEGTVIPNALKETIRADKKNVLVAIASLIVVVAVSVPLIYADLGSSPHISINLDRLLATFVGFFIISSLGLFQTWWDIKANKVIAWTVATDLRRKSSHIDA